MSVDFSHLSKTTAEIVVGFARDGHTPTDEMLLEAAERITPPLLPSPAMLDLRTELDPAAQRRGRPRKGPPRAELLIAELELVDRADVPSAFTAALISRLRSARRFREADRSHAWHLHLRKRSRDNLIRGLYRDIYGLIQMPSARTVTHPILGELEVPDLPTRSERAREMTRQQIFRLEGGQVSADTIRNLLVPPKFSRDFVI